VLSPDGQSMAWVSDATGRDEVYVKKLAGQAEAQAMTTTGGVEPVWTTAGLWYREGDRMMRDGTTVFEGRYEKDAGANAADYDVDPRGQFLVMLKRAGRTKESDAEEQECLFYVALSRAKKRLMLFASTRMRNGNRWSVSPYATRLEGLITQEVTPSLELPDGESEKPVKVEFGERLAFTESQLSRFESCPRRFFYANILSAGGRRPQTAFTEMHEVVRTLMRRLLSGEQLPPDDDSLRQLLKEGFAERGLAEHGYAADYEAIAFRLVRYFLSTQQGNLEVPLEVTLDIDGDQVILSPDQINIGAGGYGTLRRFRTGHKRYDDGKDLSAAAYILAAMEHFDGAAIQLISLADEAGLDVPYKDKDRNVKRERIRDVFKDIRAGDFPAKPSSRVCPRCPAFFVCGSVPDGSLDRRS